jgi:hypothetical protein
MRDFLDRVQNSVATYTHIYVNGRLVGMSLEFHDKYTYVYINGRLNRVSSELQMDTV